ncbi:folliculin-interacting protein 2 [Neocloeon triangulifer]|uniref:folliculin-interacting protein 2 n=1 Tax=Neocloeon triangulifer TaxID=2078957 RepID=UPI00286EC048|nr:folliculin-interacting protein 2 [Neocloeon triangulifer]
MALLNKLFANKRSKSSRPHFGLFGRGDEANESWVPFTFDPDQVRVLLFRECESRRRKILFDSSSVQKVAVAATKSSRKFPSLLRSETKKTDPVFVEVTNGFGYKLSRPTETIDLAAVSDMIFGTVPLNFQGASLKMHCLQNPNRLMCTKVFPSPSTTNHNPHNKNSDDSVGCASGASLGESIVMNLSMEGANLDKKASEGDSGFSGAASFKSASLGSNNCNSWSLGEPQQPDSRESSFNSVGSWLPNHSSGSLSSLQRRFMKHVATSMETSEALPSLSPNKDAKRSKLGLAVLLRLSGENEMDQTQQDFFFDHVPVLDSIIRRMHAVVEKSYTHRERFLHLMKEGADELQESVVHLFSSPRLPRPVWLGLMTASSERAHTSLAQTFLNDLCFLLASLETKSAHFFVSTLVTAVLTYHLGWVSTVLPGAVPPLNRPPPNSPNKMLDSLAKCHPYNALWAQFGDLKGALGHPLRVARTIVTGSESDVLNRLVRMLSYFIRCGSVSKNFEERLSTNTTDSLLQSNSTKTLTSKGIDLSSSTLVCQEPRPGLRRNASCLSDVGNVKSLYPSLSEVDLISDKVSRLCRVPAEAIMWHVNNLGSPPRRKVDSVKQNSAPPESFSAVADLGVVFVVGDDENMDSPPKDDHSILRQLQEATCLKDLSDEEQDGPQLMEIPIPSSEVRLPQPYNGFAASLMGYTSETYSPDLVVQACTQDVSEWREKLKRDLMLSAYQPLFDKEAVAEAICVMGNVDKWEVQIVSSHTYVAERHSNNLGIRQGMSQLVADMLESVHHLCKFDTPPEYCLQHIESKLREICLHSHALAQLLLATDFCEMTRLTSALNLEANDVPLLLAVASTHSPEVTQRYGLTFQ